jgi:hypothetical protein
MLTDRLLKSVLFAAYQSSLVLGIVMLPFALGANRLGVSLPIHRLVEASERAYRAH